MEDHKEREDKAKVIRYLALKIIAIHSAQAVQCCASLTNISPSLGTVTKTRNCFLSYKFHFASFTVDLAEIYPRFFKVFQTNFHCRAG